MTALASFWALYAQNAFLRLVAGFVIVAGSVALGACAGLVLHHAVTSVRRRRRAAAVASASRFLAPCLAGGGAMGTAVQECVRRSGVWATAIVLREARPTAEPTRATQLTEALAVIGEVERLCDLALSHREHHRVTAMRQLGETGGDRARDALLHGIQDQSPSVRRAARESLLADGRPASLKAAIHSYLADAPKGVAWKRTFYSRLARAGGPQLRDLLASGVLDGREEKLALEALGDARIASALPLARARLGSADAELRATAARVAGKLRDDQSLPQLRNLLHDPEWFVRAAAARAFEGLQAQDTALGELAATLSDDAWWVRSNAAHALARQGEPGMQRLVDAVGSDDAYARDAAVAALALSALHDPDRSRLAGLFALVTAVPPPHAAGARP